MKYLLHYLIIISSTQFSFGQNLNFPDSNAIWSVYNEKYFVNGDSTYNTIDYKKYYFTNDSVVTTGSFFALLREDTILKKVFSIASGNVQEHLLYDFSLSINDTVSVYPLSFPFYTGPILIKVDLIDSILIGSNYHKRLKISGVYQNTGYDEYWIEGIGSTMGIFNSGITGVIIFDIYYPILLCFEKNGITLYSDPNFTNCYENYPSGIENISVQYTILLFPNPSKQQINIKYALQGKENGMIKIMDIAGKILASYSLKTEETQLSINDLNLSSGVYLCQFEVNNTIVSTKKLIITD